MIGEDRETGMCSFNWRDPQMWDVITLFLSALPFWLLIYL